MAVEGLRLGVTVEVVWHRGGHAAVEGYPHLDDGETLRGGLHLGHIGGVVGWLVPVHGEADGAVVDAHAVAHLAAEELVDGEPGGLASHVPEGHLDRADGTPPRLEAAARADLAHDALDVGR